MALTKGPIVLGFIGITAALFVWWSGGIGNLAKVGEPQVAAAVAASLSNADNFAVLAGAAISDAGGSVITGDVGLSPAAGSNITSLTGVQVSGTIYAVDGTGPAGSVNNPGLLTTAKADLSTAYLNAEGQGSDFAVTASSVDSFGVGTINNGAPLVPGVYTSGSTIGVTGDLTLDGGGNANAVFIFQAGSSLTTASGANIILTNGAQACNVFWQVGTSATLGTGTLLKGNIMAAVSITDAGGSTVEGRLLADADNSDADSTGAVTLNDTSVVKATCVTPPSSGGSNNRIPPIYPLINVTKIPSPLNLSNGPGPVTYTYTVTNIGEVPVEDVSVNDNKCNPENFIEGDVNDDSLLDLDESWVYQCTKTLRETETNTVTACASAGNSSGGGRICDTANATVVVSAAIIPPLIHLVKVPNAFVLPTPGGAVTYMYTVTNPGTEPLDNVSVIDDKCTGLPGRVLGNPGDVNRNDLLESNEKWSFVCQTNLTETTTNIGTAEGHANGLTAIDFAPATVVVVAPKLPDTGFDPGTSTIIWNILNSTAILIVLFWLYQARKRETL